MPHISFKWEFNITTILALIAAISAVYGLYYSAKSDREMMRAQIDIMQSEYRTMIAREEVERKEADKRIEHQSDTELQRLRADMRDISNKVDKIYDIVAGVK